MTPRYQNPRYQHVDHYSDLQRANAKLRAAGYTYDALRQFQKEYPRALAKLRCSVRLRPVPVNGNRVTGRKIGYFETVLRDGTLGYFQRRTDDCAQASLATLTQIPMDQVPDPRIDRLFAEGLPLDEIEERCGIQHGEWLDAHGLVMLRHDELPTSAERWIGVVAVSPNGYGDHCLVMSRNQIVWDTMNLLPPGKYEPVAATDYTLDDFDYGITIERR